MRSSQEKERCRRERLGAAVLLSLCVVCAGVCLAGDRHVLVRDFRTVKDGHCVNFNIGTAAHCPATIAALRKAYPKTKVSVWADAPLEPCLAEMMARRFPDVQIFCGEDVPETDAGLLLVASGNGIATSVRRSIAKWRKTTGHPVAAYAIGYSGGLATLTREMQECTFRDRQANALAEKTGGAPRRHGFMPDAVFDFDAEDKQAAAAFLRDKGLVPGHFVCAIPGERHTAWWEFFGGKADERKIAENAAHAIPDNEVVCRAIVEAVRRFGQKALLCAEQRSEMKLIKSALYERLPEDVQRRCVVLDRFWSPSLALGVYRRSRCVFGIEMHSQVMALGSGVPACVFRHSGFGSKSGMLADLGVGEWCLDIDEPNAAEKAVRMVGDILANPTEALVKCRRLRARIDALRFASKVSFDCAFPGGNVRILDFDESSGTVGLDCDFRDSATEWFWTNFRVSGAAGRHFDFQFRPGRTSHRARVSRLGMAYSLDEGHTWGWTDPKGHEDGFGFSFDFPPDAASVRFALSFPYVQSDLEAFCAAHPAIRRTVLTHSRKGREVPLLTVGKDDAHWSFVFTARHHASEVPANWVMEGLAEAAIADTPKGRWLRENAKCLFVPFMDVDGCEDGDPGKNRLPHDHNRDYAAELYPEVRAFKNLVRSETAKRRIVYFDLHAPQARGSAKSPRHDNIFTMGPPPPMDALWNAYRKRLKEASKERTLRFFGKWDEPWMTDYNIPAKLPGEKKSHSWVLEQPNVEWVSVFEFGYGLCGGVSSPEALREFGRTMLNELVCVAEMRAPKR